MSFPAQLHSSRHSTGAGQASYEEGTQVRDFGTRYFVVFVAFSIQVPTPLRFSRV